MTQINRREFIHQSALMSGAAACAMAGVPAWAAQKGNKMQFGLVTYLWGQDWDLPTLIKNCEKTKVLGVELRVEHAHGVMPDLTKQERQDVKKRFEDSPVAVLGPGTNEQYDSPDPAVLKQNIERTKEFIKLSHDIGGTGVKVKPNQLHKDVPKEKTLHQIGHSLKELGEFAKDYGQMIRLEVHGRDTSDLPNIRVIMDAADHPNVGACWNCNDQDLQGQGLEYNFNLVKDTFGDTVHVRELNEGEYPYQKLMNLFVGMDYAGWILLEARTKPDDRVKALAEQREIWESMIAKAQASL